MTDHSFPHVCWEGRVTRHQASLVPPQWSAWRGPKTVCVWIFSFSGSVAPRLGSVPLVRVQSYFKTLPTKGETCRQCLGTTASCWKTDSTIKQFHKRPLGASSGAIICFSCFGCHLVCFIFILDNFKRTHFDETECKLGWNLSRGTVY